MEMGDTPKSLLDALGAKIQLLMARCDALQKDKSQLRQRVDECEQTISVLKAQQETLQIKYQRLKMAKALSGSDEEIKASKVRLNKLVREIDKCISLLNE